MVICIVYPASFQWLSSRFDLILHFCVAEKNASFICKASEPDFIAIGSKVSSDLRSSGFFWPHDQFSSFLLKTPFGKWYFPYQPGILTLQLSCQNWYYLGEKHPTKALSLNLKVLPLDLILEHWDPLFENHTSENSWLLFHLRPPPTQI